MAEHKFGGDWTEEKLDRLERYLKAYRTIFTKNPKAKFFSTWYVDAFAGTGTRFSAGNRSNEQQYFQDVYQDRDTRGYKNGSAKIALALPKPFDQYCFIEKSENRVGDLKRMIEQEHPRLLPSCEFRRGDANSVLKAWCAERNWNKERAVVFLDPYGMQVESSTIEALAATKAIDLWYLFPLGVGVARLLTHSGAIDEGWQERLDKLFGTTLWRTEFYRIVPGQPDLFRQSGDVLERDASTEKIEAFIHKRLAATFAAAEKGLILRNSRNSPLYLLCFAAGNEKGAPTATKIARQILKD